MSNIINGMDYSSGIGIPVKSGGMAMQKPRNPANDPLTDNNYLGQGRSVWNQPAAQPAQNSMQTSGLYRGGLGTYTGNVADQVQGLMNPNGAGTPAPAGGSMPSLRETGANYLQSLATNRVNPYARGGDAYTANRNYAVSQPSGMLQRAQLETQRKAGLSGFGQSSGLVQQAQAANRLAAAKQSAQMGGQIEADMANRAADWADRDQQFKYQLGQAMQSNDLSTFDRLRSMEQDVYNRNTFDPLKVQGLGLANESAMLGNQNQRMLNQYQPQMLQQGLSRGQQQLDAGQLGLDRTRALQPGEIDLALAQQRLGMKDANYMGQYMDEAYADYMSPGAVNLRAAERDPRYAMGKKINQGTVDLLMNGLNILSRPLGMAYGSGGGGAMSGPQT